MRAKSLHNQLIARILGIAALMLALTAVGGSTAAAQGPDIRNVRPAIMLLVDTSGSMERRPGGTALPMCTGGPTSERNRWTTVLEALTGSWPAFSCTAVDRRVAYPTAPDATYRLPYHRPPAAGQLTDGVLDVYSERAKFGLMTYDNIFGLTSVPDELMVRQSVFTTRLVDNAGAAGDYSYGLPRELTFPGCATTYMVDGGARREGAPAGALVSVGDDLDDYTLINATIQTQLLAARPFGATPTAALLDDFRHYLATHPDVAPPSGGAGAGDPFAACRPRYAILLTDGQPNDPYRDFMGCGTAGYTCPYDRPSDIAADLCRYNSASAECTGQIDGLFVVGFDVGDAAAQALLDDLADRGGTERASMATDRLTLLSALGAAIDQAAPGTTTRTSAAFGSATTTSSSGPQTQFQFNSGFKISDEPGEPWSGVLDRTRFTCDASDVPRRQPIDPRVDSFHEILNELPPRPRRLLTVATPQAAQMTGVVLGTEAGLAPLGSGGGGGGGRGGGGGGRAAPPVPTRVTGQALADFDVTNTSLTAGHFGISGGSATDRTNRRRAIIDWVHGRAGTTRYGNRFGDIYHSTPVTVGAPRSDLADEWYNLFRRRADVAGRPSVIYVGTNDGVLHAFATEAFTRGATSYRAGEEIWGFIPPSVVPRLESATASHQILVDGVPVVHDVFYQRLPGAQPTADPRSPAAYRTVLVMGLRAGGNSYFALDVTDPLNPMFLWQYTERYMGLTFARAAVGQVLVEVGGVLQERAIALLPGGRGDIDADAAARTTGPVGCPAQGIGTPPVTRGTLNARSRQRCWGQIGRDLSWVDLVTGETLFSFTSATFNAPVTGGVSLFTGDTGTLATRAFLTDDDGVMWRIDMSSRRTADWTATPFHDIFHDGDADDGQPGFEPPVITTDAQGRVVVIQATGNVDVLDGTAVNRVVSLTEQLSFDPRVPTSTELNWEIRLRAGEQVTGPLDLYNGVVYFGSFESTSGADACNYGQSRIWGVEYRRGGGTPPLSYTTGVGMASRFPLAQIETTEGSGVLDAHFLGPYLNQIVMGVQVTQQITCLSGTPETDTYIGQRYRVASSGGGQFQLSAQVSGASGAATPGTSSVRTITRSLAAPAAYTRVFSWTPQADR